MLLALAVLSVVLLTLEVNTRLLEGLRSQLNTLVSPLRVVAEVPYLVGGELDGFFASHSDLRERNDSLQLDLLKLSQISQQYATLRAENDQLRELLGSRRPEGRDVLVAEVIGLVPNPLRHQIIIDKGRAADVRVGLAVIDAKGLVGQVVEVDQVTAQVLLLADVQHAVPVSDIRTGLRGIASGTGDLFTLQLEGIGVNAELRQGDLMVSSGYGQRFPKGYPVGTVASVQRNASSALAEVELNTVAALDRVRHVLVVLPAAGEVGYGEDADQPTGYGQPVSQRAEAQP